MEAVSVFLRTKGWYDPNEVVQVSPEAFAEAVAELRRRAAVEATLTRHSEALQGLLKAIKDHGTSGEEFADAYRAAVVAVR